MPSLSNVSEAFMQAGTSEPVAIKFIFASSFLCKKYPPASTSFKVLDSIGSRFCRDKIIDVGPSFLFNADFHAIAVSKKEAGRHVCMFGVDLKVLKCSIG